METTVVEMTCSNKSQTQDQYNKNADGTVQNQNKITFDLPYEKNNIFYQLSGGTKVELNTVNQDAANMFEVGKKYKMEISKVE